MLLCQSLSKKYGATHAIKSLDLHIEAGGPVALVGPNGAGKTTLFSLICGYIRPSHGQVSVCGRQPGSAALRGMISVLPQDAALIPGLAVATQLKHLARLQGLSRHAAPQAVERSLECVHMRDAASASPEDLSHGMRKRVSIAQALLGQPELVLLDEPTAGLDPPSARVVRDMVRQQSQSATFIVSSHNLFELEQLCTRVVLLEKGELKAHQAVDAADHEQSYLTLVCGTEQAEPYRLACQGLSSVSTAEIHGDCIVVAYDRQREPAMDLRIIECMHQQGLTYRSLTHGRSLEERLFGREAGG